MNKRIRFLIITMIYIVAAGCAAAVAGRGLGWNSLQLLFAVLLLLLLYGGIWAVMCMPKDIKIIFLASMSATILIAAVIYGVMNGSLVRGVAGNIAIARESVGRAGSELTSAVTELGQDIGDAFEKTGTAIYESIQKAGTGLQNSISKAADESLAGSSGDAESGSGRNRLDQTGSAGKIILTLEDLTKTDQPVLPEFLPQALAKKAAEEAAAEAEAAKERAAEAEAEKEKAEEEEAEKAKAQEAEAAEAKTAKDGAGTAEKTANAGSVSTDDASAQNTNTVETPDYVIEFGEKYPEAADFVADYPTESGKEHEIDVSTEVTKGKIPLFIQWDERWGYEPYGGHCIGVSGCGPTALSMVLCGLTGETEWTPDQVAEYSDENGYYVTGEGTSWALMYEGAEALGLTVERGKETEKYIRSNLSASSPMIASMYPGDFTQSGHFIVLTGFDEDGKVLLCDPNSPENSSKSWDMDVLLPQIRAIWKFTVE